jgi:hypothetical protein
MRHLYRLKNRSAAAQRRPAIAHRLRIISLKIIPLRSASWSLAARVVA